MARWMSKRWAWAAVVGATVSAGLVAYAAEPPQKVGSTITLNIDGKGERQFKVLKCEKQPDGTYLSELKDTKSGETITLLDKADGPPPPAPKTETPKAPDGGIPKMPPRATDPLTPPVSAALPPDMGKDKEKDTKRPILGRIFGDKDKTPAPAMKPETPAEPAKKPGLMARVFGPKKPTGPSMPAAVAGPAAKPGVSAPPPAVQPTPPGGLTGTTPPPFAGTTGGSTAEPPRVMPARPAPVTPPTPTIPAPAPIPTPPITTPTPTPVLPIPVPMALPGPTTPPPGGTLPIPIPPGGTSAAQPLQIVVPAGHVPAGVAFDREVEPLVIALQSMSAPSARLTAARSLAEGRHRSTDGVKGALFQAAQQDPCGEVRAACIDHLCKLGYFNAPFLAHVQAACGDPDPQVSTAAKAACAKMLK